MWEHHAEYFSEQQYSSPKKIDKSNPTETVMIYFSIVWECIIT